MFLYALNSFLVTVEAIWNEIQPLKQMKQKWMPAVNGKKKYSSVCSSEILSLGTKCWKFLILIFWNFIIMKLPIDIKTSSITLCSFVLLIEQVWPQVDLFSSVQISHSVMSNSLRLHESQHMTGIPVHHQLLLWDILFPLSEKKNPHF